MQCPTTDMQPDCTTAVMQPACSPQPWHISAHTKSSTKSSTKAPSTRMHALQPAAKCCMFHLFAPQLGTRLRHETNCHQQPSVSHQRGEHTQDQGARTAMCGECCREWRDHLRGLEDLLLHQGYHQCCLCCGCEGIHGWILRTGHGRIPC